MSNSTDYIDNRIKFFSERVNDRTNTVNPATGERGYKHDAETRRKAQIELTQLHQSRVFQAAADARLAQQAVAQREADVQAQRDQYAQNQAIRDRAQAIRLEREAVKMANSGATLVGPGSEVTITRHD